MVDGKVTDKMAAAAQAQEKEDASKNVPPAQQARVAAGSGEPNKANKGENLSSDPNKDPSRPITMDHGQESDEAKAAKEQAKKDAKDPWGSTPVQMRGDAHVNDDEALKDEPVVGGTLPPLG